MLVPNKCVKWQKNDWEYMKVIYIHVFYMKVVYLNYKDVNMKVIFAVMNTTESKA